MSTKTKNKVVHLSGLNGIRAIAVLAVVISHTTLSLDKFDLNPFIFGVTPEGAPRGLDLAGFGVSMFFSLSGFLITYLLLLEKAKQEISVRDFYIRRILRIHPLYFLYLAACLIIIFIFHLEFSAVSLACYLLFAANIPLITGTTLPFLAHYWSLGVEEQFYIFYPWIVKKTKDLSRTLILFTVALIIIKLIFRIIDIKYNISWPYLALHVTRFQCMLIGSIGALCFYNRSAFFRKFSTNIFTQLISWLCIILIMINQFHIISVLDQEITAAITVFIIFGQITKTNRIINLDLEIFDFIGKISYGIYVIHPLTILFCYKLWPDIAMPVELKYVSVYGMTLMLTIGAGYISYRYFEKKFLAIKYKYGTIKTSGTKHAELPTTVAT